MDTNILWEESEVEVVPVPLPEDQLQSLVCREEQLFTPSQLVGMVGSPSQVDPSSPAPRSAEVESALQSVNFPWYKDVEEQEEALLESQEDSEAQQGQGAHSLPHFLVESSVHEVSQEEVEQDPPQPEQQDNIQDLVLEAQCQASFQATLDAFSGCSSRPQPPSQAR